MWSNLPRPQLQFVGVSLSAQKLSIMEESSWSLPLKQRLRKRKEREIGSESSSVPTTSVDREPGHKKRKIVPTHAAAASDGAKLCSLRSCGNAIDSRDHTLVEVKVGMKRNSRDFLSKCLVNWHAVSGEAQFHGECWSQLEKDSQSRGRGRSCMIGEEKKLVKEASETAEWHDSEEKVEREATRIADLLRQSSYCIAFTGAGISTSAGIGDYRGKDGKWTEMDRTLAQTKEEHQDEHDDEEEGVAYEQLRPTYTHEALVKLIEKGLLKHVISQNGDGLHGLSGIPPERLSELHGNVFLEICEKCGHRYHRQYYVMDDAASQYFEDLEERGNSEVARPKHAKQCELCGLNHRSGRRCEQPGCKGHLNDSIINFRDNLEEDVLSTAEMHAGKADLCLSLGTTMQVTPACELVEMGKKPLNLVIVNRQTTPLDHIARQTLPPPNDSVAMGVRIHGDTDCVMQGVMKRLMSEEESKVWESGRGERMRNYDLLRTSSKS